jgi:hypothetical protein
LAASERDLAASRSKARLLMLDMTVSTQKRTRLSPGAV